MMSPFDSGQGDIVDLSYSGFAILNLFHMIFIRLHWTINIQVSDFKSPLKIKNLRI